MNAPRGTPMPHVCHATGCTRRVPTRFFMCAPHWYALPFSYRAAIWAAYRPGQENDKYPSPEYLAAAHAAINYLGQVKS